jgi:hypothetical protein
MGNAWEHAVNAAFVKTVGQYMSDMQNAVSDDQMERLFDRLCNDYESAIVEITEPSPEDI